jgi:hypothetical protein
VVAPAHRVRRVWAPSKTRPRATYEVQGLTPSTLVLTYDRRAHAIIIIQLKIHPTNISHLCTAGTSSSRQDDGIPDRHQLPSALDNPDPYESYLWVAPLCSRISISCHHPLNQRRRRLFHLFGLYSRPRLRHSRPDRTISNRGI